MKERIKIDSAILSFVIILTGFLYLFPQFYAGNRFLDSLFDCLGVMTILKGTLLRMSARGHKKAHSQKSKELVTTGPYTLSRNPMYLGSFLMGAGFILMIWPWWSLPIFAFLFYLRFNQEMVKEEAFLKKEFGTAYEAYCERVPRVFPSIEILNKTKLKNVFNVDEAFSTKEKRGLVSWMALAFILEIIQEKVVYGIVDIPGTFALIVLTMAGFTVACAIAHHQSQ